LASSGERYAEKFKRLLQLYPNPETGLPWKGVELEKATNGVVNSSWISALKKGQNNRPGLDKLRAISDAMGFPFDLWLKDPAEWKRPVYGETLTSAASVAEKLNYLFSASAKERGEPLDEKRVAEMSQGRLSESQVRELRTGQRPNPSRNELLALSDVFDVDFSYWDDRERPPLADPETLAALRDPSTVAILHKSRGIPQDDRDLIVIMLEEMERRRRRAQDSSDTPQEEA
jgi:transcriptional regulator with XRE-family HTH domain